MRTNSSPRQMPKWVVRMFTGHRSVLGLLAVAVGALCGLASVGFHYLIELWSWLMTGYKDYTLHLHAPNRWFNWGVWFLILVPAVSGLIYGPMIARWAPTARGHGIPEVMLAVRRKGGKIPGRVAVVKILASALTIGGGGSAGREGPIVQVGAALGSWISTRIGLPKNTVILLAGCGAAGGIAATFNAPLAGAVFAMELILITFNAHTFGMAVLSSVSASVVSRLFLGREAIIALPTDLDLARSRDLIFVAIIGVIGSLVGLLFTKVLYLVEDMIDFVYRWPEWLRPGIGGLVVGALLLIWPQLYGSGYPIQLRILEHGYSIAFILFLLAGRVIATSITIGIGGSGGVFAPTLFMGACAGAAFGQAVEGWSSTSPATYGVICMGAAFAGAARAPITAVLIIVEMTGQYNLILPIMLAVVLSTGISRFLSRKTIYTTKLIRRGDYLDDPRDHTLIGNNTAREIMSEPPTMIAATTSLHEAASVMHRSGLQVIPVVRPEGEPRLSREMQPGLKNEQLINGCVPAETGKTKNPTVSTNNLVSEGEESTGKDGKQHLNTGNLFNADQPDLAGNLQIHSSDLHANSSIESRRISDLGSENKTSVADQEAKVQEADGFCGCVSQLLLAQARAAGVTEDTPVGKLNLITEKITADSSAETVLQTLMQARTTGLPVIEHGQVVGWISQRDLVSRIYRQYRRALEAKNAESSWGSRIQTRLSARRHDVHRSIFKHSAENTHQAD